MIWQITITSGTIEVRRSKFAKMVIKLPRNGGQFSYKNKDYQIFIDGVNQIAFFESKRIKDFSVKKDIF